MKIDKLVEVIKKLRSPNGCPWDREQTSKSLIPQLLEEVYELIDAIYENDYEKIKEELGDVLLHIVFQTILAEEKEKFSLEDVVKEIVEKIVRRHPHVFGNQKISSIEELNITWEKIKSQEKGKENRGLLDGIPKSLPSLMYAYKITKKVQKVGFDWPDLANLFEKLDEELQEFEEALIEKDKENIEEEFGDVLFMLVNLARKLKINPEEALIKTNRKFLKRFKYIEEKLKDKNLKFSDVSLEEMDKLWEEAKKLEKIVEKKRA